MGGKTSTSTSQVQIPPEVLARYNSVNQTAENVAQTPFQQYSTNPNAFVAPITSTQQAGIQNTNAAAGMAQPYFQTGTGFALAGSMPVNAAPLDTSTYMNPYLNTVLGATAAQINQNNQQAMSGQTGNAMSQGYFGGDRSGIASAVLQGQQNLAAGQVYSGIASDAYNQALAAAQQQQGVNLSADQANRAAMQQTGQSLAELGTGAQGAALSGAQAQLGAGQVEQQTQQAGLTALYNQFLQQQSYPFQTAQFLANIAEGTGALSGSTTQTTQPQSIFSDERLKEDMQPVGKGFDGANIYRFRYKDDPDNVTRLGFSAQEVERRHPEAVSEHGGFKAVDYGAATDDAARRGFALAANDNSGERRERQSGGGMSGWGMYPSGANPMVIQQLLESQAQMYGPYGGEGGPGLYGHSPNQIPHGGSGYVPAASLPVGQLQVARAPTPQTNGLGEDIHQAASLADDAEGLQKDYHLGHEFFDWAHGKLSGGGGGGDMTGPPNANGGRVGRAPGGLTAADYAAQAHQAMNEAKIHAAAAQAHRAQATRQAQDAARARGDIVGPSGGLINYIPGVAATRAAAGLGRQYGPGLASWAGDRLGDIRSAALAHQGVQDQIDATRRATQQARQGAFYGQQGVNAANALTDAGFAIAHAPWTGPVANPARLPQPKHLTYTPPAATSAQVPRGPGAVPGVAGPSLGAAMGGPGGPPAAPADLAKWRAYLAAGVGTGGVSPQNHAIAARHHAQLAQAHAQAAGDPSLAAPTATGPGGTSANLAGDIGLPSNVGSAVPINVGDVSNLQTGFAPANIQPYHEDIFHRVGDWLGGHFGSDAQRMAYDARGMTPDNSAPVIQSRAFANAPQLDDVVAGASQREAPPPMQTEDALARSDAFTRPVVRDATDPTLAAPITLANGGFARAHRDMGGGFDPSNPQSDDPYKPQGPGLNIPTAETQHAKLATAAPPSASGGGLGSAVGMGSDLVNIAKFALPFFGVPVKTGGRVGYATNGAVADPTPAPDDDPDASLTPQAAHHDPGFDPQVADTSTPATPQHGGQGQGGGGFGGLLKNIIGAPIHMLGEAAGYEGNGQFDKDRLMPFLQAVGAMGATPTVHPLFALSQGLGAYGKSYMAQKQQEAQIEQEQAGAQLSRFQAQPLAQQSGYMELPGPAMNPDGTINRALTRVKPDGRTYYHLGDPAEESGAGGAGGALAGTGVATPGTIQGGHPGPGAPAAGPSRGPIQIDYDHGGAQTWAPSATSDQEVGSLGLSTQGGPGAARMNRLLINRNQGLQNAEAAGQQAISANQSVQPDAVTNAQNLRMLGQAINEIPAGGIGAMGTNYEGRQHLLQALQTARRMIGLPDDADLNRDLTPGDIISKINALSSTNLAHATGQHSAEVAGVLRAILPSGGSSNPAAANHIIAGLMTQNQRQLDFGHFANAYLAKYGTSIGVQQAFQDEMTPIYGQEQQSLERMLGRNGRPQSMAEYLSQHRDRLKDFEQGYGGANGLGMGIGRYFPGGA